MSVALIERIGDEVDTIDVFSGFGGASQGLKAAGVRLRAAANHNELALECYGQNFGDVDLWLADLVDPTNPKKVDRKGKEVVGRYVDPATLPKARLAWFSPSCFPAGTLVLTKRGLVPIEGVAVGDEAWTHMNRWRPVTATMSREAETVTMTGDGNRCLELTPNHRLWACASVATGHRKIGERMDVPAESMAGKWWATPTVLTGIPLPEVPAAVDWRWLGRWIGDGWTDGSVATIRCGVEEADELAAWLPGWRREYTSLYWPVSRRALRFVDFAMPDVEIARWLGKHFGKDPEGKHLPAWALALRPCDAQPLLDGYLRGGSGTLPLGTITTRGTQQSVLAIVVPNRTNNEAHHGAESLAPLMAGTVSQGVVVAGAGNTSERAGQTRARSATGQLFTQSTTAEFGVAAMPALRGTQPSQIGSGAHASGQLHTITSRGGHDSLRTAFTQKMNGSPSDTAPHSVTEAVGTITTGGKYGIDPTGLFVVPTLADWTTDEIVVTSSLAVATALIREQLRGLPPFEGEITDEMLLETRWGMLEPDPEIRRGMAFGDDFVLIGNKGQMTAGLGNAVTPPVASWITGRCLETLG